MLPRCCCCCSANLNSFARFRHVQKLTAIFEIILTLKSVQKENRKNYSRSYMICAPSVFVRTPLCECASVLHINILCAFVRVNMTL